MESGNPYEIPEEYMPLINRSVDDIFHTIDEAKQNERKEWVLSGNKAEFKLWIKSEPSCTTTFSESTVHVPVNMMLEHCTEESISKMLDYFYEREEVQQKICDHLVDTILVYRGIWPISGRYFHVYRHWRVLSEGQYLVCWFDVPNSAPMEKMGKKVLGSMLSAYLFQAIDEHTSKATMLASLKLNGSIPTCVQNTVNSDIPYQLTRLGEYLSNHKYVEKKHEPYKNEDKLFV